MKKVLIVITALFFGTMLFLTFFAETIHSSLLPHVIVSRAESRLFPGEYTDENGNVTSYAATSAAIPAELVEKGAFVVYSAEKNGTKRTFVRFTEIRPGRISEDGYVEVLDGINLSDRFVVESSGELYDGCEVIIEE